jgi:hypothetical protein
MFSPWHAVTVVLCELCRNPQGALADRAWEIIQSRFKEWNGRVAGTREAMLWGPIKRLLNKAVRKRNQQRPDMEQSTYAVDLDLILQDVRMEAPTSTGYRAVQALTASMLNFLARIQSMRLRASL